MNDPTRSTLDLLREGRDLLAKGWTQEVFFTFHGDGEKPDCFCMMGCILEAHTPGCSMTGLAKPTVIAAVHAVEEAVCGSSRPIEEHSSNGFSGILATWNDDPYRTQAETVAKMDEAIAALEASA
jgi:hypothetical protein